MGPDDLLIRVNEDSVLAWLSAKVERATRRFAELAAGSDAGGGGGSSGWALAAAGGGAGFAKDFRAIADAAPAVGGRRQKEVEAECRQRALEAVCEYLGDEWATRLAEKFRYNLRRIDERKPQNQGTLFRMRTIPCMPWYDRRFEEETADLHRGIATACVCGEEVPSATEQNRCR